MKYSNEVKQEKKSVIDIDNLAQNIDTNSDKPCPCQSLDISLSELSLGALPSQPCNCVPYSNLCCCEPQNGISIIQPSCQTLPNGDVVNNPAYVAQINKSFWTYKFMTDCSSSTRAISNLGIPICQLITAEHLTVFEKIDGCGTREPVPFTLTQSDPNLGPAPVGFQFVKIDINDRYDKGVTVEYQLEIDGDYPIAIQPISVKAATNILVFDCGCFQVPQCNPQGKLSLYKECNHTITNNQATLIYHLTVSNIGNGSLTNVQFNDAIVIPTNLNIGDISFSPSTLVFDTTSPGKILIIGNLGTIAPGKQISIDYTIKITGVTNPGSYIVANAASVSSSGTQSSDTCSTTINAVQVDTHKCCIVNNLNKGTYRFTISNVGLSPNTLVDVLDNLFIPAGITLQFTSFDGCTATFANTNAPVPLNTNITGPITISIVANSILVLQNSAAHKNITFVLISSSAVGVSSIENTLQSVTPTNPDNQIFLGAGSLPIKVNMDVALSLECTKPCSDL